MSSSSRVKSRVAFPVRALLRWYARNRRDLPWRETKDAYAILVSEVMLQQTQVATVIPYFLRWMKRFPDAKRLAESPDSEVLKCWEGLGYYRRARNLQAAARELTEKWNGRFPPTMEGLRSLPGVGRYTAGAVGSIALGWRVPVVDGNVIRVLARWLGIRDRVDEPQVQDRFWRTMEEMLPKNAGDFNQAMMELGATVCRVRSPDCAGCPISKGCRARAGGWQESVPRSRKVESVDRVERAVLWEDQGGVWLIRRGPGEWHEGLWALPSVLKRDSKSAWVRDFNRRFNCRVADPVKLFSSRYQVTRHRIRLEIYGGGGCKKKPPAMKAWGLKELDDLAIVTAHRKFLRTRRAT